MLSASWKTTLCGVISAIFSLIAFNSTQLDHPGLGHVLVMLAQFVVAGGLAAFGITAKDYNITGGTKQAEVKPAIATHE